MVVYPPERTHDMGFINLQQLNEKEPVPGFKVRFIHSENMTLAYWDIKATAALPEHSHFHEQVVNVIEGEFELSIEGEANRMGPGSAAIIPPNALHAGRAITDCRIIDVFYPVRDDYR